MGTKDKATTRVTAASARRLVRLRVWRALEDKTSVNALSLKLCLARPTIQEALDWLCSSGRLRRYEYNGEKRYYKPASGLLHTKKQI
jgi:CRISPR/Cas system-associated endonuclease Cas1